jgi:hypothetical protein
MTDVLEKEIAGGDPITVRIRGSERPLLYTMHAFVLYKQLTGDSLFVQENFAKIDVREDPDRWLKCLWAGLHQFAGGKWTSPFTLEELGALLDYSNTGEIAVPMAKALTRSMPKADPDARKEPAPEVADPAPVITREKLTPISSGSTSEPAADSVLVGQNS